MRSVSRVHYIFDKQGEAKLQFVFSFKGNLGTKAIDIIRKPSFFLLKFSLRTLYFALVYPYSQYCNMVWAATYPSNLSRLVLLQKRVVRTITKSKYDVHTNTLFKTLNMLMFSDICKLCAYIEIIFSQTNSTDFLS